MSKKVIMNQADRELAIRVSEFMQFHMSAITDSVRHRKVIADITAKIDNVANLKGSIISDEQIEATIAKLRDEIDAENTRYEKARKDKERWAWYKEDIDLYNAIASGEGVSDATIAWLSAWKLSVGSNTNIVKDIVEGTKGVKMATARTIVNSGAKTWTKGRTKVDVLKTVYAIVAEYMVKANTLKAVDIPEDIRQAFAPKKRAK